MLDLAWSPGDRWLATCSVDNTVVVWDVTGVPASLAVLRGHSGHVKGVTWDPVGKYLATQSADKSLRFVLYSRPPFPSFDITFVKDLPPPPSPVPSNAVWFKFLRRKI